MAHSESLTVEHGDVDLGSPHHFSERETNALSIESERIYNVTSSVDTYECSLSPSTIFPTKNKPLSVEHGSIEPGALPPIFSLFHSISTQWLQQYATFTRTDPTTTLPISSRSPSRMTIVCAEGALYTPEHCALFYTSFFHIVFFACMGFLDYYYLVCIQVGTTAHVCRW